MSAMASAALSILDDDMAVSTVFRYKNGNGTEHLIRCLGRGVEHPDYGEGTQLEVMVITYVFRDDQLIWSDQSEPAVWEVYTLSEIEEIESLPQQLWLQHPRGDRFSYEEITQVFIAGAYWDAYFDLLHRVLTGHPRGQYTEH